MIHTIEYCRAVAAGLAARVWRALRAGECPCGSCRGHRAFIADGGGDPALAVLDDQGDAYRPAPGPSRAYLPTVDEARDRRHT